MVAAVALLVEVLFMELLHEFFIVWFRLSGTAWGLIDAAILTAFVVPALYFLVFRKIRESEQRFRQTLAIAPDAIVIVDGQGRITDWNHASEMMFGYSQEEAMGQRMHQLLPPHRYRDDAERGFARFEESGEGPVVGKTIEISALRKDGSEFPVELSISAIREEMGLAREVLEGIHFGGLIHDLGKISVPAEILGKPGRLSDIEFGLIKTHAEAGYQIVKGIAFPWPVADMVRQHHERLDGSGYPQGLKDGQIVLEARILAVADVVEAMSADRPYRPGFGLDAALEEIIRARGAQLDPVAVDACLRVIREKGFVFTK